MIIAVLIWRPDPVSHWKVAFFGVRNRSKCYSTEIMWYFSLPRRPCVGLTAAPPEEMQWFCSKCANKRKDKKHKKRKHRAHWRFGRGLKSCGHRGTSCPDCFRRDHPARAGAGSLQGTRGEETPWGRGSWVSQPLRAQGVGFWYILMLFLSPFQGEFAQSTAKTWVVPGSAPARAARQQTRTNVVNTDTCPILSRFVINLSWTFAVRCWEGEKM